MPDPRHRLGLATEDLVADRLRAAGWRVRARRYRCASGELDLVCLDPAGVLVGIEVRARRSPRAGSSLDSVDQRRVRRLRATLLDFAARDTSARVGLRVDLVTADLAPGGWRLVRHPAIDAW